ncbi:SUKH-4 family immunity protein [Streptomyces sp. NPDC048606]|uniref:SUKH-4 family immunity protein n=1 Tax=Streptomyces sp. NPDC048606 TaxID=3154726 RepID=UPI00342E88FB
MAHDDLDVVFSSPAALLTAGPARARGEVALAGGVGREVFSQAEAVFGRTGAERAEFASRLHFAAKVLGRDEYAAAVEAAEPGLPWRTVWAWWRPVGAHRAEPNLSGDRSAEVHDHVSDPAARPLLKVWSLWTPDRWFDLDTGAPCEAPAEGAYAERADEADEEGPILFEGEEEAWASCCPEAWEEPVPLGGGRFLLVEARGVFVAERNPTPAAGSRPAGVGDADDESEAGGGSGGEPWFVAPDPAVAALDAARVDEVFGARHVRRTADSALPQALTHAPTRELLTRVGLPVHWGAGVTSFALAYDDAGPREDASYGAGLLHLGDFDLGYADTGRVLLRPDTGELVMSRQEGPTFRLARDAETFVRLLESVRRHMGSCWDPYPGEDGHGHFLREVTALEPTSVAPEGPARELWEHVFASITEIGVDGY